MKKRFCRSSYAVQNLRKKDTFKYQLVGEGVLVGLLVGLVIAAFRLLLEKADAVRGALVAYAGTGALPMLLAALLLLGLAGAVALLLRAEPDISGSGIPQVEGELRGQEEQRWWRVLVGKFAGCVLALCGGLALGREGPSIQIGAMVGKGFARRKDSLLTEERMLITCGAGAGLSAAFGAPLAGVIFSLEELHRNFSAEVLISTMAATAVSDYVAVNLVGLKPVFDFDVRYGIPLRLYWAVALLGVLLGAFGVLYNKMLAGMQTLFGLLRGDILRMVVIFAVSFLLFFLAPWALGSGHGLVAEVSAGRYALGALALLLLVKLLFSTASFGSGAPGGIFLPLLVLGALSGGLFSRLLGEAFGMDQRYITAFVVIAMAGFFAAIVRAPVTGVILITEMTGNFTTLLTLVTVSLIAYVTAELLRGEPVYDQLLKQRLKKKAEQAPAAERSVSVPVYDQDAGASVYRRVPARERKAVIEAEVYLGAYMDGRRVAELGLPYGNLIVAIVRDGKELIPGGQTVLTGGDELEILCRNQDIAAIGDILNEKCKKILT